MTKLQTKIRCSRFSRLQKKESHQSDGVWIGNKRYLTPRFLKPFIKTTKAIRLKGGKLKLKRY